MAKTTAYLNHLGRILFPQWLWWTVLGVIGVATAIYLTSMFWAWMQRREARRTSTPDGILNDRTNSGRLSLRKIPSAIIAFSRIIFFRVKIPFTSKTVMELSLTAAYIITLFVFQFVEDMDLMPRIWADRAGHLAASQIPLLVALSTKNNIIGMMTGLGHEKINVLHRMISRTVLILVWVHMFGRVKINASTMFDEPWKIVGMAAGMTYTVITLISIKPFRKRYYEFFVITHIILVTGFLIMAQYHTWGAGFGYYLYACWVIWFFDRSLRSLRVLALNVNVLFSRRSEIPNDAVVEALSSTTTRITIRRRIPIGWVPGQHVFVKFPGLGNSYGGSFESHPFTIVTTDEMVGEHGEREMVFIVRARDGMTRRLYNKAVSSPGRKMAALIEGPYGAPPDLSPYHTCIFVAGGSGVTYTIPRFRDLMAKASNKQAVAKRVLFVWAIRDETDFEWISRTLYQTISATSPDISVSVHIYVTGASPSTSSSNLTALHGDHNSSESPDRTYSSTSITEKAMYATEKGSTEEGSDIKKAWEGWSKDGAVSTGVLKKMSGRPDIKAILEEEIGGAKGRTVSVDVSGPAGLVTSVRGALSLGSIAGPMAVLKGEASVHLNVEEFNM